MGYNPLPSYPDKLTMLDIARELDICSHAGYPTSSVTMHHFNIDNVNKLNLANPPAQISAILETPDAITEWWKYNHASSSAPIIVTNTPTDIGPNYVTWNSTLLWAGAMDGYAALNFYFSTDPSYCQPGYGSYLNPSSAPNVQRDYNYSIRVDNAMLIGGGTLTAGTTYYVAAYANNYGLGLAALGAPIAFTMAGATVPNVETVSVTTIASSEATFNANLTSDCGSTVQYRGFYYISGYNDPIDGTQVIESSYPNPSTGSYLYFIAGLSAGTHYRMQAWASNGQGSGYGEIIDFDTNAASVPTIRTDSATGITSTTAYLNGYVESLGGSNVSDCGFWYSSVNSNPTSADTVIGYGTRTTPGIISAYLGSLSTATQYWFKAYGINSTGTGSGAVQTFTTGASSTATVITVAANIVNTTTVSVSGSITSNGGSTISQRGFCYGANIDPTTADVIDFDYWPSPETGPYYKLNSNLTPGNSYYIRAYAINGNGTSYGSNAYVTMTNPTTPSIRLDWVNFIGRSDAIHENVDVAFTVTSFGGTTLTLAGVVIGTGNTPTVESNILDISYLVGAITENVMIATIWHQFVGTYSTLYARAYARNSYGTTYSTANTLDMTGVPTIIDYGLYNITATTADLSVWFNNAVYTIMTCNVSTNADMSSPIILNLNPVSGALSGRSDNAEFRFTGLIQNTTYYFRITARNYSGTDYYPSSTTSASFTTLSGSPTAPTVETANVTGVTGGATAQCGGNVSSAGSQPVTTRGVCWNTSATPTIANSKTTDGTGTGIFTSTLTSLSNGVTYYVRAYATNSVGTSYGTQRTFTNNTAG